MIAPLPGTVPLRMPCHPEKWAILPLPSSGQLKPLRIETLPFTGAIASNSGGVS